VSGIEPLTCRLQEDRPDAPDALAAAMTWAIALTAFVTLGLSGDPVHEPVHAGGENRPMAVTSAVTRTHRSGDANLSTCPMGQVERVKPNSL
jgi:hypothetical protein